MIMGAATAAAEIKRLMPALRAELDRLDLMRVKLSMDGRAWWQGKFEVTGAGAMDIPIGASLDPLYPPGWGPLWGAPRIDGWTAFPHRAASKMRQIQKRGFENRVRSMRWGL
jgi:hypothetical protein